MGEWGFFGDEFNLLIFDDPFLENRDSKLIIVVMISG